MDWWIGGWMDGRNGRKGKDGREEGDRDGGLGGVLGSKEEKHDLGFTLMNQLSVGEKQFPRREQDIAADYFALRKVHNGSKWIFTEGPNAYNPASHCDIAWAGALATCGHTECPGGAAAAVVHENGWSDENGFHPYNSPGTVLSPEAGLLWSDDPRIWKPLWR